MNQLFTMQGPISRGPYAAGTFLLPLPPTIVASLLLATESGLALLVALIVLGITQVAVASHVVRRFHDLGRPGTHFWLLFIPGYNIYLTCVLLFKTGDAGPNQYGASSQSATVQL